MTCRVQFSAPPFFCYSPHHLSTTLPIGAMLFILDDLPAFGYAAGDFLSLAIDVFGEGIYRGGATPWLLILATYGHRNYLLRCAIKPPLENKARPCNGASPWAPYRQQKIGPRTCIAPSWVLVYYLPTPHNKTATDHINHCPPGIQRRKHTHQAPPNPCVVLLPQWRLNA